MRRRLLWSAFAAFAVTLSSAGTPAGAADPVRGVTDTEIVIGTITDLSGVTAVQGVNNSDAIRMAFDEANDKGGVHGRKIKYIVEDNQYTVPRAVQAMNKLLNSDNIFLALDQPKVIYDLPAGGRRLDQTARGYAAMIVSGKVVYRGGKPTGELPGRLVRGQQHV